MSQQSDSFAKYMDEMNDFLSYFLKRKELPKFPNSKEAFLTDALPSAIKRVIRFQNVTNGSQKHKIKKFFQLSAQLVPYTVTNNVEGLYSALTMLLDPNSLYYTKNRVVTDSGKVFFYDCYYEIISNEFCILPDLLNSSKNRNLNNFKFVFQIYGNMIKEKSMKMLCTEFSLNIFVIFTNFLKSFNNLKEIDTKALQDSLDSLLDMPVFENKQYRSSCISSLLEFLIKCLKSEMIEKQAFAARVISKLFQNEHFQNSRDISNSDNYINQGIQEIFEVVFENTMKVEIRPSIITLLIPFLEKVTAHINFQHPLKLYEKVQDADESEQSPIFEYISSLIANFEYDAQDYIIDFVMNPPLNFNSYRFIKKLTKDFWKNHTKKALSCVSRIMEQTENDSDARDSIFSIYQQKAIPSEAKAELFEDMLNKLMITHISENHISENHLSENHISETYINENYFNDNNVNENHNNIKPTNKEFRKDYSFNENINNENINSENITYINLNKENQNYQNLNEINNSKGSNKEDMAKFAFEVLKIMVESCPDLKKVIKKEVLDDILYKLPSRNNRKFAFMLITLLFQKAIISELLKENIEFFGSFEEDDILWNFYKEIVNISNFSKNSEAYKTLMSQTENAPASSFTRAYTEYIVTLINISNKSLFLAMKKTSSNTFSFEHPQRFNLLFKVYLKSPHLEAVKIAKNYLIEKFTKFSHLNLFPEFLSSMILPYFENIEENTEINIRNLLQFVLEYIKLGEKENDPEDYGMPRHKYPDNYIVLKCKYSQNVSKIHIDPTCKLSVLLNRIARRTNGEKVTSTKFSKNENKEQTLSELNIKDGDNFEYSKNILTSSNDQKAFPLSYYFAKKNVVLKLLSLSDSSNNEFSDVIEELLNLFPTDQSIKNEIMDISNLIESLKQKSVNFIRKNYKLSIFIDFLKKYDKNPKSYEIIGDSFSDDESDDGIPSKYKTQEMKERFINEGGIKTITKIESDLFKNPIFFEFLDILFDKELFEKHIEKMIPLIFSVIIKQKSSPHVFSLMAKYYKNFKDQFLKLIDPKMLNQSFDRVSPNSWNDYAEVIGSFSNESLFCIFMSKIIGSANNDSNTSNENLSFFIKAISKMEITLFQLGTAELLQCCINLINCQQVNDVLGDLVKIINSISKKRPDLEMITRQSESILFELVFKTDNEKLQESLLQIIEPICSQFTEAKLFDRFLQLKVDRWNYNPSSDTKNQIPFVGLRNLGATCFFNSIIQQLYHLFPVQYLIATYNYEENSELLLFRKLFLQLRYSNRKYCDTNPFLKQWHGWFKELIPTREQQDAVEFFDILINQLPPAVIKIFSGKLKNTMTKENGEFFHTDDEPFSTIGVSIKDCKKLEDSFQKWKVPEDLTSIDEKTNKKINISKLSRISEAPPILVVHMKRFEYDLKRNERIKINERFEFPYDLNIGSICEEGTDNTDYHLNGIVVHTGTAIGGHYTSYIRKKDCWWKFNDNEVGPVKKEEVEMISFGKNSFASSAYVLFYVKNHFSMKINEDNNTSNQTLSFDNEFDYSKMVCIDDIISDNQQFMEFQASFCRSLIDFVKNRKKATLKMMYFLNILCHSEFKEESGHFAENLIQCIKSDRQQRDECLSLLKCETDIVFDNLMHSPETIIKDLKTIVVVCCEGDIQICHNLLELVESHVKYYHQIPTILDLVYQILRKNIDLLIDEELTGLFEQMTKIIRKAYSDSSKSQLFSNFDYSGIFKSISRMLEKYPKLDLSPIKELETFIKKSLNHNTDYRLMVQATKSSSIRVVSNSHSINPNIPLSSKFSLTHASITQNNNNSGKTLSTNNIKNKVITPTKSQNYTTGYSNSHAKPGSSASNTNAPKKSTDNKKTISDICKEIGESIVKKKTISEIKEYIKDTNYTEKDIMRELSNHGNNHHSLVKKAIKRFPIIFHDILFHQNCENRKEALLLFSNFVGHTPEKLKRLSSVEQAMDEFVSNQLSQEVNKFYNSISGNVKMTKEEAIFVQFFKAYKQLLIKLNKIKLNEIEPHHERETKYPANVFDMIMKIDDKKIVDDYNLKEIIKLYCHFNIDYIEVHLYDIVEILYNHEGEIFCSCFKHLFNADKNQKLIEKLRQKEFKEYVNNNLSEKDARTLEWEIRKVYKELDIILCQKQEYVDVKQQFIKKFKKAHDSLKEKNTNKNKNNITPNEMKEYVQTFFDYISNVESPDIHSSKICNYYDVFKKLQISSNFGKIEFDSVNFEKCMKLPGVIQIILGFFMEIMEHSPESDDLIGKLIEYQIKTKFNAAEPKYMKYVGMYLIRHQDYILRVIKCITENNLQNYKKILYLTLNELSINDKIDHNVILDLKNYFQSTEFKNLENIEFFQSAFKSLNDEELLDIFAKIQGDKKNLVKIARFIVIIENIGRRDILPKMKEISKITKGDINVKTLGEEDKITLRKVIRINLIQPIDID